MYPCNTHIIVVFATGRDSATFRDKGTEVPTLSRDKGTTGQAQNLATGRDGTGFVTGCPVPSRDVPGQNHLPKKAKKREKVVVKQEKDVPKQEKEVPKQENEVPKQERTF
jgi:hypothetical protein